MAGRKVEDLTAASALTGAELVYVVQGSEDRQTTTQDIADLAQDAGGTVTSVSVTTANGVSGSVATATTTPAITLTLGAITPTSVTASGTVQGGALRTGTAGADGVILKDDGSGTLLIRNGTDTSPTSLNVDLIESTADQLRLNTDATLSGNSWITTILTNPAQTENVTMTLPPANGTDLQFLRKKSGSPVGTFELEFAAVNSFSTIAVSGQSDVVADATADTLTLAAGTGITLTTNAGTDTVTITSSVPTTLGKQAIDIKAGAMQPTQTNGAAAYAVQVQTTGRPEIAYLAFDPSTTEYAQFSIDMPEKWNGGTVTFRPIWTHPATTTNFGVVWGFQAVAVVDDGVTDAAFGTAQTSSDTGGTTYDQYNGPESSAITVAGSPSGTQPTVYFQVYRDVNAGGDSMGVDAWLLGLVVYITTEAGTDA